VRQRTDAFLSEAVVADPHLMAVANALQKELRQSGLQPTKLKAAEAESDGWWTPIANWKRNRPRIELFFDKSSGDGQRHFWFGFSSSPHQIKWLSERVPRDLQNFAVVTDADFDLSGCWTRDAATRVRNANGVVYEQYPEDDHYFGKFDIGIGATPDEELVKDAVYFVRDIVEYIDQELKINLDIEEIERRKDIDESRRKQLIDARRGQGAFRRDLFGKWGGCSVTGCTVIEVLRASHIKPWRDASDDERLDPNNGLLLIATLDALFDRGLVSFENNGDMIVSSILQDDARLTLLPKKCSLLREPSEQQRAYLDRHRKDIFRE
jgi:HNH endonuclease